MRAAKRSGARVARSAILALLAIFPAVPATPAASSYTFEPRSQRGKQEGAEGAPAPVKPDPRKEGEVEATYLYSLSTNFGALPLNDVNLSWDPLHRELYVSGGGSPVRVFNESGMEVFIFGDDPEVGYVLDIASLEDGDLVALTSWSGKRTLVRCTFRGEFLGRIEPSGVPPELASFAPTVLRFVNGKIYLADTGAMRVLVLDVSGAYVASYDIARQLGEEESRADLGLRGFGVDRDGNILFTIQPLFGAYVMAPDGKIQRFGMKGSAPGKFNVVGGIARDDAGNYFVADILKSAILVFDRNFVFRKEFGYRGGAPGSLAAPEQIATGGDRLFVSNRARRGVSVFQIGAR